MLPKKFHFIWPSGFRAKYFFGNQPIRNKNCLWRPCFANGSKRNEQSLQSIFHRCFLPGFGPIGQSVSEDKIFRNQPIRNKNCLCQPCFLMDRDEISNLYREPSIDASYKVSVHLGKRFQRRTFFRNQPIKNQNCLRQPCLLTDQDEISNIYRGTSIDASYHVSVHLAKQFQRRRFLEIDQPETGIAYGGHVL